MESEDVPRIVPQTGVEVFACFVYICIHAFSNIFAESEYKFEKSATLQAFLLERWHYKFSQK